MIQATEFYQSSIVQGRGICFLHASDFIGKAQIENVMQSIRALFFSNTSYLQFVTPHVSEKFMSSVHFRLRKQIEN